MCGITGFIDYSNTITKLHLQNASTKLQHRGGNGNDILIEEKEKYTVGLANERLATIDLSQDGLQPFTSACGKYTITFNGTIYNYVELRQTLIKYGVTFSTLTDTEVLLECYKKWGNKLFDQIDGAFAFAILDRNLNQLFIARDAIGVKPLYIYKDSRFFFFSSEIKALITFPIEKRINKNALQTYLRYGYFLGKDTIYENIYSFKQKHYMVIDLNSGNNLEQQFNLQPIKVYTKNNEADIIATTEELLTDSILKRNIADVNTGVLLSGGYDSATVTAILQKNQAKRIKTFTLGFFKNKKLDEAPFAKKIATYLKTNHKEYYIDKKTAAKTLALLPEIFDEPMGDSGAIALTFITQKIAEQDIKVLLGAEGGDELFGGYTSYLKAIKFYKYAQLLPKFVKKKISGLFKHRSEKLKEVLQSQSLLDTYININAYFTNTEISNLLNDNSLHPINFDQKNDLKSLLKFDLENYLPNDLLLKTDRICMYFGIDNRDAMLKTDLTNYLKDIDDKWLIKNGETKYILKKISHKYIPKKLMDRPKKGFSIPLSNWLKTCLKPYVEEYLSVEQLNKHQLFNVSEVFKLKNAFYAHGAETNAKKIWLLLQFQMWYNKWMV